MPIDPRTNEPIPYERLNLLDQVRTAPSTSLTDLFGLTSSESKYNLTPIFPPRPASPIGAQPRSPAGGLEESTGIENVLKSLSQFPTVQDSRAAADMLRGFRESLPQVPGKAMFQDFVSRTQDDITQALGFDRAFGTPEEDPTAGIGNIDAQAKLQSLFGSEANGPSGPGGIGIDPNQLLNQPPQQVFEQTSAPLDETQFVAEPTPLQGPDFSGVQALLDSARPPDADPNGSIFPVLAGAFQGLAAGDGTNIGQSLLRGAAGGFGGLLQSEQEQKQAEQAQREFALTRAEVESDIEQTKTQVANANTAQRDEYNQRVAQAKRRNAIVRQPNVSVEDDVYTVTTPNEDGTTTTKVFQITDRVGQYKDLIYAKAAMMRAEAAQASAGGSDNPLANMSPNAQAGLTMMQDPELSSAGVLPPEIGEQVNDYIESIRPGLQTQARTNDEAATEFRELYYSTIFNYGLATLNELDKQQGQQ